MSKILAAAVLLFSVSTVLAQTVVGRLLQGNGLTEPYPAAHVPVTLADEEQRTPPAYTDTSGYFYFHNINPGTYTLEVWVTGYKIGVPVTQQVDIPNQPEVELDPLIVPPIP